MKLSQFIEVNRAEMLSNLMDIVFDLKCNLRHNPSDYLEPGTDVPAIDIRLAIDLEPSGSTWIFRTGLFDYDPKHSFYCAASCVTLDTDASELLDDLINQLF